MLLGVLSHNAGCCSSCCPRLGSAPHRCHLEKDSTRAVGSQMLQECPLPLRPSPVTQ